MLHILVVLKVGKFFLILCQKKEVIAPCTIEKMLPVRNMFGI